MHPDHVATVQRSFAQVAPFATQAAQQFYRNLFEADPSLRPLFRGDMALQGERLMAMLSTAVTLLGRPATLLPALRVLGARHVRYGVQPHHYATVGAALLKTLEQGLGAAWTLEAAHAWAAVYRVISDTMLEGANEFVPA